MGLSEEEKKELSVGLLREWWMVTTQALSDIAGKETAIKCLAPYHINAGIAASQNMPRMLNIEEPTLESTFWIMALGHNCMFNGHGDAALIGNKEIRSNIIDCSTHGSSAVICTGFCETTGRTFTESYCPKLQYNLLKSVGRGDSICEFSWVDSADRTEVAGVIKMPQPIIPEEAMHQLSLHLIGESWNYTVKALIDYSGKEKASEKLAPYMQHSGLSLGIRLANQYGLEHGDNSINEIIKTVWLCHHGKSSFNTTPHLLECTIDECPFSDGPTELCFQYSSFFNGLLEALNPSYEFVYDHMMTKGDGTCHWTIRKKGEVAKEKAKEEASADDPIKRLTNMFIDGEITEEELERKVAHLRKLGLVK